MLRALTGKDVRRNTHACCFIIFFIFVSIGVPLLVLGCNANVEGGCLTYDVVRGTVFGYRLEETTCQNCADDGAQNNNPHSPKTCGPQYACDNVYVELNYGGPEDNCELFTGKENTEKQFFYNIRDNRFPLNTTHTVVLKKGDDSVCLFSSEGIVMWSFGVVFLALTGVTLLCWVGCTAFKTEEQYNNAAELSNVRQNQVLPYAAPNNRTSAWRPPVQSVTEIEMVNAADLQRRHAAAPHTCGLDFTFADVSPALASPAKVPTYASAPTYAPPDEILHYASVACLSAPASQFPPLSIHYQYPNRDKQG